MRFLILLLTLFPFVCSAQLITNSHLVSSEEVTDNTQILCYNEERIVYRVESHVEMIGDTPLNLPDETSFSLVVLNEQLELEDVVSIQNGWFNSALFDNDGHLIISGGGDGDLLYQGQSFQLQGNVFFTSLEINGQVNWVQGGYDNIGQFQEMILNPIDNSFYWTSTFINEPEGTVFYFGGEEHTSLGSDFQWNSNSIILKFSEDGEELWARVIQGTGYNRPLALTVDQEGSVNLSLRHQAGTISSPETIPETSFSAVFSYAADGTYTGKNLQYDSQSVRITDLCFKNDDLKGIARLTSFDSLLFADQYINAECIGSPSLVIFKNLDQPDINDIIQFHCTSGSDELIQNLYKDEFGYWLVFRHSRPIETQGIEFLTEINDLAVSLVRLDDEFNIVYKNTFNAPGLDISDFSFACTANKVILELVFNGPLNLEDGGQLGDDSFSQTYLFDFDKDSLVNSVDEEGGSYINVYPNPCNDFLYIDDSSAAWQNAEIYSLNGSLIRKEKLEPTSVAISIQTSELTSGLYYLCLSSDKNRARKNILFSKE